MADNRLNRLWAILTIFLAVSIIAGGIVLWSKRSPESLVEISNPQPRRWQGQIHVGGAVNNPGLYPLSAGDTIDSLLRAAGNAEISANLSGLELFVPAGGGDAGAQKVDINRADAWLLEALPGIGETLAERIVDYRESNGQFRSAEELLKVPGIGASAFSKIKDLVTVGGR